MKCMGMMIETKIKISKTDLLGDSFGDDYSEKLKQELIEEHIQDYCKEHKLNREDVKVIK